MTYRDTVRDLGDRTAVQVAAIVAAFESGRLDHDEAAALIASYVTAANSLSTGLADAAMAAHLSALTGEAVPSVGLLPRAGDLERLTKAAGTLLEALPDTADTVARAERLGRSEPLERAAEARGEALAEQPQVEGWVRAVNGGGCQLCQWWARDGRVWPKDHRMPTHKGCSCSQTPVVTDRVKPLSTSRRIAA